MKKILFTALAFTTLTAQSNELITFSAIVDAINQGKIIRFVMDLKKCDSEKNFGNSTVMVVPNALMVINNNRITASDNHFTLDNPNFPDKPTFDYNKFNINADGKTSIKLTVMNAIDYKIASNVQIHCELGEGFKVFN